MPIWLWIAQFVMSLVGPLIFNALKILGIGTVTYVGINLMLDQVSDYIISRLSGLPNDLRMILGLAKLDVVINIVLSAVTTRFVMSGLNKGTGKKSVRTFKGPAEGA